MSGVLSPPERFRRLASDRDDHEDRLRRLELWQTEINTVLTLLRWTFGASILGALIGLLNLIDMMARQPRASTD
jgi:hypothetical protein